MKKAFELTALDEDFLSQLEAHVSYLHDTSKFTRTDEDKQSKLAEADATEEFIDFAKLPDTTFESLKKHADNVAETTDNVDIHDAAEFVSRCVEYVLWMED